MLVTSSVRNLEGLRLSMKTFRIYSDLSTQQMQKLQDGASEFANIFKIVKESEFKPLFFIDTANDPKICFWIISFLENNNLKYEMDLCGVTVIRRGA